MLKIKKILLPLDLEETVLPVVVVHQAAVLAHHFQSEILVLHVVTPLTYIAGSDTARELIEQDVASKQKN
jgi:Universal stress protein family